MTPYVAYSGLSIGGRPRPIARYLAGLIPGATLFVIECGASWPLVARGERSFFQFGAMDSGPRIG